MKKRSLKRLSAFFNISLVVLLLVPNFIIPASVFAYDFPSTNELNKNKEVPGRIGQTAPYVDLISSEVGDVTLQFFNYAPGTACFEHRSDGESSQYGNIYAHPVVSGDYYYYYFCLPSQQTTIKTYSADEYVEIRLAFGGERDWDFDWTRFDVLPVPIPPSVPILEYPIDDIAINDNTPLMQWSDSTDSDGSVSHYLYRVFYNCTNIENIPNSCSVYPNLDGLKVNDSQYQAGTTNDNTYYWQVRAVDNDGNLSEWSQPEKVTIDTILPTKPVFTAPENNLMSTVNSIRLTWTGGDDTGSGIKNHIFGYTFTSAQSGNISFWNTGLLLGNPYLRTGSYGHGEGKYEFYVKTIDNAGNESPQSDILTVYFDGTAPAMPAGLYWMDLDNNKQIMCGGYSNTHHTNEYWDAIMGDVSFSHYEYSSFNAPNGSAGLVEKRFDTNFFNSSWWNIPTEGTYGFRVRSVDTFGNKSNWALTDPIGFEGSCKITIDWTAPVVEITNPSNNSYVNGTVSFRGSVTDENLLRYYYYIGGVVGKTVVTDLAFTDQEVYSWNTTSKPDGLYTMRLEARDKANNKTAASVHEIKVTVDNTLPTGEITGIRYTTEDSTNFITNDKSPLIFGTSDDNYEVDSVEVKIGDVLGIVTLDNDDWIAQFPTLSDGTYTISLKITDKAGNITEVTKNITIDSVAPSAVYTHYIKGELFEGEIAEVKSLCDLSFTGAYTDPDPSSGLKYDSFVIFQAQDDGSFGFAANGKQSYCSWRTSPNLVDLTTYNLTDQIPFTNCIATLPDGEYYMSHQVFDNAVRNDIPTISQFRDVLGLHFVINNTPVVTITTPFTEVLQGTGSFTVEANAVDGNAPLQYEWTGSNGFTSTEKSFTFMPALVGVYTYTVKVTDADGDMDQKSVTITVKAPTIEQPQDIQAVLGTTNTTMTPVVTRRPLSAASVFETTPEVVEEEISVLPEILGEEDISCVAKAVSGHVYLDKNENNAWDKDDKAFSNIKINITTKDENDEKIVEEFTTNEEGEWKTTLCAGKYLVSIDTTSIPENYKLNGDSTIQIDVLEGDTKGVEQSFLLTESKTFLQKYWWILLLAILVVTSIVIAGSKKDEKQSS